MSFMDFGGRIKALHPCFGGEEGARRGRIHLPVSPSCNICCGFCTRGFGELNGGSERFAGDTAKDITRDITREITKDITRDITAVEANNRPGIAAEILSIDGALAVLKKALSICPDISVVGIAGPGDPLATAYAIEVFREVHRIYPHLIKCLSTNGLMLPRYADDLKKVGASSITVTVNAVNPDILKKIVSAVVYDGARYVGTEGAELLIRNQLDGIRRVSDFAVVKVNTVLIPDVNDGHIGEIARAAKEAGAGLYNIIPLIPQGEFKNTRPPDCAALLAAREIAERYLPIFRHCKRCRADACGVPGVSEYASELYTNRAETFSHG